MRKISVKTKELSSDFANFLQDMMGKRSPYTVMGYRTTMCLFIDYQKFKNKRKLNEFTVDYFTKQNIEEFMKWLLEVRKVSKQTCNTRVSQICAFFKYMRNNPTYLSHYIELRDVARVRMTVATHVVEPLSRDAIKALIAAPGTDTETGLRYTALFSFLYSSATRIDEALSIKIKDLNLTCQHPYVIVVGKGRKARSAYLVGKIVSILKKYIAIDQGKNPDPDSYLFHSRSKGLYEKCSTRGVNKQLIVYCRKAAQVCKDVPYNVHTHLFRHSMATHCLEDGMNIFQISKMLGHKSVNTTMIYLGFTINMMNEAVSKIESTTVKSISPKWKRSGFDIKNLFR